MRKEPYWVSSFGVCDLESAPMSGDHYSSILTLSVLLGQLVHPHFFFYLFSFFCLSFMGKGNLNVSSPKMWEHIVLVKCLNHENQANTMLIVILKRYYNRNKMDVFWFNWFHSLTTCLLKFEVLNLSTWVRIAVSCFLLLHIIKERESLFRAIWQLPRH